jgi:putative ABC transport system ATP-binding protein
MAVIELEDIVKVYTTGDIEYTALKGISLSVEEGEYVSIMGPSGSGKSTLMHSLGCLDRPTSGKYILDGVDVSQLSDGQLATVRNQKLGFVFQAYNLLRRTSALANVELPMLYSRNGHDRHRRALEALKTVGLEHRAHNMPNQMSGGEQQRVAIARALVNNPRIIMADEPTGNLDTRTGIGILKLLQDLNDSGVTIVMVTHGEEVAMHTRRIVFLRDGIVESDRPVTDRLTIGEPEAGQ